MKPLLGATAISIEASDEQLVEWAQTGSSEAFAVLFRRYRPAIARYAGRILGDDARAEDIAQEVFLSALRSIGTLDRPAGFKPWLYRIAHNTCVDHMRRTGRAEEVSIDANLLPPSEEIRLFRRGPSTHAAVTQKEDFKNLREAFGGLPPAQSEMLVMRELEGLSYDEIAAPPGRDPRLRREHAVPRPAGPAGRVRRDHDRRALPADAPRDGADGGGHGWAARQARARPSRARLPALPARRLRDGSRGPALEAPVTGLRGGLSRVAALLPLPWLIHRRADDADAASAAGGGGGSLATPGADGDTQLSSSVGIGADQAATAIHKAVAVVAAVAVVGGGGYVASKTHHQGRPAAEAGPRHAPGARRRGPRRAVRAAAAAARRTAQRPLRRRGWRPRPAAPAAPRPRRSRSPLVPTARAVSPGPIDTLGVPDAGAAPATPGDPAAGGDSPSGTTAPDSTSGTDTTLPAAGDTGSSTPSGGTGSTDRRREWRRRW